jgi:predicted phosphodiesterase
LEHHKKVNQAHDLDVFTRKIELRGGRSESYMITENDADVIVLAGDIALGTEGIDWAGREAKALGKPVVYVAGNHEFYGKEYCDTLAKMRAVAKKNGVHFLERDEVVIGNTRILGCTLWVDFEATGDKAQAIYEVYRGLADFSTIRVPKKGICDREGQVIDADALYRYMTPNDQVELFEESVSWLHTKLAEPFDGRSVVVTHHGPTSACQHPNFPLGHMSTAFWSDLEELVVQADLWIYGHTHASLDIEVKGTRLVANQLGYPSEYVEGFEPDKIVEI